MIFVFFVMIVDHIWHYLVRSSMHTYAYGASWLFDTSAKNENRFHRKLYLELFNRFGIELFTLGTLSFVIFALHEGGFFDFLASVFTEKGHHLGFAKAGGKYDGSKNYAVGDLATFNFPISGSDWHHLAEEVHVRLFVGMVLYFILMLFFVRGTVWRLQLWETFDDVKVVSNHAMGPRESGYSEITAAPIAPVSPMAFLSMRRASSHVDTYRAWKAYFINMAVSWETRHPKLWEELLGVIWPDEQPTSLPESVERVLEANFSLARYLAYSLQSQVMDAIQVSSYCWIALMMIFAVFVILFRFGVRMFYVSLFFHGVAVIAILAMYLKVRIGFVRLDHECQRSISEPGTAVSNAQLESDWAFLDIGLESHAAAPAESDDPKTYLTRATVNLRSSANAISKRVVESLQDSNTETYAMRIMEVELFVFCFTLAHTLIDRYGIVHAVATGSIAHVVLYIGGYILLALSLPAVLPMFLVEMAMPPNMDKYNFEDFRHVLQEARLGDNPLSCTWNNHDRRTLHHRKTMIMQTFQKRMTATAHAEFLRIASDMPWGAHSQMHQTSLASLRPRVSSGETLAGADALGLRETACRQDERLRSLAGDEVDFLLYAEVMVEDLKAALVANARARQHTHLQCAPINELMPDECLF